MRWFPLLALAAASCGQDTGFDVPPPGAVLPMRVRLLTDAQYENAVHDLFGDVAIPALHSPGTTPAQFIHEDVLAVDAPLLVQYRIAAEIVARAVAADPGLIGCAADDGDCMRGRLDEVVARAFRRPLDPGEHDQLAALFAQGAAAGGPAAGLGLVVEAVFQAPSFVYRTELGASQLGASGASGASGAAPGAEVAMTPYELAAALGFFLLDSIPDEPLWQAARDGSLAEPAVVAAEVERLLGLPRVRDHLVEVVLDWLEVPAIDRVGKDAERFPEMTPELRASMSAETRRFVADVLWHHHGSLRALLTSNETFIDARLARIYGVRRVTSAEPVPVSLDPRQRGGILTQASMLARLATEQSESIIRRGMFVNRKFLCMPEVGRPPFAAIAMVAGTTNQLSEAEFSVFRTTDPFCGSCHTTIDPPGRALHRYDGLGRWRELDLSAAPIDDRVELVVDDRIYRVTGALELQAVLADSEQVARCVVDQLAHHALGRTVDDLALRDYLYKSFERSERDLVEVFRAIATAPGFRLRRGVP